MIAAASQPGARWAPHADCRLDHAMNCTLVRPPETSNLYYSAAYAAAPLGLAYVAASLRQAGHQVRVVDAIGEAPARLTPLDAGGKRVRRGLADDEILERIPVDSALVGFGVMFSQDWLEARTLIRRARARLPRAAFVAGGEHATAQPAGVLSTSPIDYVLAGEADRTVVALAEHVAGRRPIEEVASCHFHGSAGEVRRTSAVVREADVDALPWPAWDLVPIENYLAGGHGWGVDRGRNMPMLATRGCPYRCTFCSSPAMWTTRWVARSAADVVREMRHYVERYDVTNFDFQDLTLVISREWVVELAERILAARLAVTWQLPSGTRSEALDAELLRLVVRAGCRNIVYAPESGATETLARIEKRLDAERLLASMRVAVKSGCNVKANFVFGFPHDRYRSLLGNLAFLVRLAAAGVHDVSIAPFRPYPGSELFRSLSRAGRIPEPLDDAYYRSLSAISENLPGVTSPGESYCEVPGPVLDSIRALATLLFYAVSWTLRPVRVLRLASALVTERQESRLDKSLIEMKRRLLGRSRRVRGPA